MDLGNGTVLKVTGITKKYGTTRALDEVSIEIKCGMIYGLTGENEAGKPIPMRTIMGLIPIGEGSTELSGTTGLQIARRRMGQSIGTPTPYSELAARDNLRIQAASGDVSDREVGGLLRMMRSGNAGKKKAKSPSLGMCQRLATTNALIMNPKFLILDESTNGMDPAGMAEMREIIQRLIKGRDITVLLSSHLLDGLSRIVIHYGTLHEGHLIKELLEEELMWESRQFIKVDTSTTEQTITVLDSPGYRDHSVQSNCAIQLFEGIDRVATIDQALAEVKVPVDGTHLVGQKLEDCFSQLTGDNPHV